MKQIFYRKAITLTEIKFINKFLVVLYNMSLSKSPTIRSLVDWFAVDDNKYNRNCELVIWDNSPISCEEEIDWLRKILFIKITFVHTPQNTPLSKIYNTLSSKLMNDEYLTLLDQDSFLTKEYFEEMRIAQFNNWPLILPKVICDGVLVSPGTRFFAKGKLYASLTSGVISSKNLLAINSGMSVHRKVFNKIKYDERLLFYGTDTYFMKRYEKCYSDAYLIDATIDHTLSENDPNVSADRKRQIEKAKRDAWQIIFSDNFLECSFLFFYVRALILRDFFRKFRMITNVIKSTKTKSS